MLRESKLRKKERHQAGNITLKTRKIADILRRAERFSINFGDNFVHFSSKKLDLVWKKTRKLCEKIGKPSAHFAKEYETLKTEKRKKGKNLQKNTKTRRFQE